ncbi:MAG TPA: glycoside hydrolase family 127 protein, partial [Terrimicrobiaceae bacterium]|nr:glycoside hydrolase family 127 protein [Terrimicrobiaceae bacterium]
WQADALAVEKGDLVHSGWTWPAVSGIPFPQGKFAGDARLSATLGGVAHPIRPLAHWPDGSIKWGLVQLKLAPGLNGTVKVGASEAEPAVAGAVHLDTNRPGTTVIRNDLIRLVASPAKGDAGVQLFSGSVPVLTGMQFYFTSGSEEFSVHWNPPEVIEAFPERATVEWQGDLVSASGFRYGRCRMQASLFAGTSSVRLLSTVYNETAKDPFQASAYGWKLSVPEAPSEASGEGWFTTGVKPAYLTGAIRYFRQLSPNGIALEPGTINLQLFRPGDKATPAYQTHPGEAKTHEIWLAVTSDPVSPAQAKRFSMLVDRPPGLGVAALIRSSGVWGPMAKIDPAADAELYQSLIASGVETYFADVKTGLRAFGNYPGFSSSFYWNSLHSMYALYAMTGERKWLDRAERSVRHLMDLLVCHWSPEKTNLGGMYSYYSTKTADGNRAFEPDFSNADFSVRSQNPHAAFDHWQLTGDADGKRIAIGIADFLLANPEMREHAASGSARHQGWVLIALARAYEETHDPRYRDYARTMLQTVRKFVDPRRGSYLQIHSSVNHPGIVPFMAGILATGLRNYHEVSGDPEALELLTLVVTATQEETVDRTWSATNPGLAYHYSPNPHHRYEHVPGLNLGLVGGNAYLAALTGNKEYATTAREGWKGFLAGPHKSPNMEIYNLPDTLFWLKSLPREE